jgi:pimeloyl-ACP methyl ester carboxylesterase
MATPRLAALELPGADGEPIRVDVRTSARAGEARPAVLICHGFKGFKDWGFFPKLAERLATAGFTAVSFNFSGSGVRDGDVCDQLDRFARQRPTADLQDLRTVADHAATVLCAPVLGLVGHSRGGALAVLHAAGDARVRALVTWAAVHDFLLWPVELLEQWRRDGRLEVVNSRTGQVLTMTTEALDDLERHRGGTLNIVAAAGRIRVPWLVIHGSDDATVPVSSGVRLAEAAGAETELLLMEGADHTFGIRHPWQGTNPVFDQVLERTVGWLAKGLL